MGVNPLIITPLLDLIIAVGSRGHFHPERSDSTVRCADGFTVSVIAGGGTYCHPRPAMCYHSADHEMVQEPDGHYETAPHDYPGPFDEVEVGFPSARPEPWDEWRQYAEESERPTDTVYSYVPVETVRALIELHGGEV